MPVFYRRVYGKNNTPWIYRKDTENEKGLKVMLVAVGVAGCNPAKKKKASKDQNKKY